jgi:HEAT repeats/Protein of unknown function (DUF3575)
MNRISQAVSLLVVVTSILWTAEVTAGPASKAGNRAPRAATGLESDDPSVRRQAITKLIEDRDPSAVAQLSLALESDNDESVRREAAGGLGDLGDKRGTTALKRCLQVEPSETVKRSCRVSLARLDPAATTADPSQPASAPAGNTAPAPSTMTTTSPGDGHAAPTGTTSAGQQLDLRINVTAEDAATRPNHVYIDLVSALDSTLALGIERVVGPQWSLAIEPQLSAQSESANGLMASTFSAALAVRPHFYFLQHAPSGPYIAPFGSVGYYRVTLDLGQSKQVVSGTTWAVGAGVGWSLVVNARAVFKLSAVFAYARTAATVGANGMAASSWAADFSPFISAGVMF